MPAHEHRVVNCFEPKRVGLASTHLGRQRCGIVYWVLRDYTGAHHPLSSTIKLVIPIPRKKRNKERARERKKERENVCASG